MKDKEDRKEVERDERERPKKPTYRKPKLMRVDDRVKWVHGSFTCGSIG